MLQRSCASVSTSGARNGEEQARARDRVAVRPRLAADLHPAARGDDQRADVRVLAEREGFVAAGEREDGDGELRARGQLVPGQVGGRPLARACTGGPMSSQKR